MAVNIDSEKKLAALADALAPFGVRPSYTALVVVAEVLDAIDGQQEAWPGISPPGETEYANAIVVRLREQF